MPTVTNPSACILDITKWLQLGGGFIHPAVEIVHSNDANGYSLRVRATHEVCEGSRIALCPSSLTMSVRSMERAEQHWPEEFMSCFMQSPEVLTRFFLMEQFLIAENSFWYPYIRMLPQPADDALDTPMFYTSEDCAWIRGTNLEGARKARLGQWKQEYQKAVDLLKSSDMSRYELLRENWRELYIWAATILTSRCFSSNAFALDNMEPKYISNVSTPEQRLPLTFPSPTVYPVLLPVLDFGNHDPSAGVYWKMQGSSYSFIVNETLKNGKEICISYDNKGNEELIMGYGFSLFNNPKDAFRLLLKSTATSRNLTKARDMQQELQQHQIETSPGPSASHGLDEPLHTKHTSTEACSAPPAPLPSCSPDIFLLYPADSTTSFVANNLPLIDTFSILVANARELRTISISPTRITIPSPLHPPTHNLLRLSSLLLTELSRKHSAITTHTPSLPLYPTTTRQFHAARYRRRQLHILATNIHALHTLLHGANTPTTHLLRLEDILAKPASAGQPPNQLRAAIHHILRTRSPHRIRALGHEDLVFTLWLCAEWLRREPLPFDKPATGFRALLRRWLRCLETDYGVPPSGPVVHSLEGSLSGADDAAHGDDDDDDGDERTVIAASYLVVVKAVAETAPGSVFADRRWSVELLQWGLGIVQEEGVVVPGGTDGEEDEFVLFVGQW